MSPKDEGQNKIVAIDWLTPQFSMIVYSIDGTQLMRLFEDDKGILDVEWTDPPRQTDAAQQFIVGVTQLWNSLR